MERKAPKIILIKPYVPPDRFGTISPWDVPSLGLGYIAAVLEQHDKDVSIIDAFIERIDINQLIKKLKDINPDIIGITSNVYSAKYACYTALNLQKHLKSIIVMGGPYATTAYEYLLKTNLIDIAVLGEGEYTFLDLVNVVEKNGNLNDVKGIAFKNKEKLNRWIKDESNKSNKPNKPKPQLIDYKSQNNNSIQSDSSSLTTNNDSREILSLVNPLNVSASKHMIIINERRPYIENLDEIPFPAWHLFPNPSKYKNLRGVVKRPYLPIITTRGCTFSCLWCNKNIHGFKIRARSIENVIEEIKYFYNKYGIKEFAFMDDNFTYNEQRIFKFCYLLMKNNIKIAINLYPGIRADKVTKKIILALKTVGLNRVTVGVESGNQMIVKKIGKKLDLNRVKETVKIVKKAGLVADGFFMLGLPMDTKKTMEETIKFAKDTGFDHAYFFVTVPFPGTPLFTLVSRKGHFIAKYFLGIPKHIVEGKSVYEMGNINAKLVEWEFKRAYLTFYFRIKKIFRLSKIYGRYLIQYRSFTEIKWLISQFLFFFTKLK